MSPAKRKRVFMITVKDDRNIEEIQMSDSVIAYLRCFPVFGRSNYSDSPIIRKSPAELPPKNKRLKLSASFEVNEQSESPMSSKRAAANSFINNSNTQPTRSRGDKNGRKRKISNYETVDEKSNTCADKERVTIVPTTDKKTNGKDENETTSFQVQNNNVLDEHSIVLTSSSLAQQKREENAEISKSEEEMFHNIYSHSDSSMTKGVSSVEKTPSPIMEDNTVFSYRSVRASSVVQEMTAEDSVSEIIDINVSPTPSDRLSSSETLTESMTQEKVKMLPLSSFVERKIKKREDDSTRNPKKSLIAKAGNTEDESGLLHSPDACKYPVKVKENAGNVALVAEIKSTQQDKTVSSYNSTSLKSALTMPVEASMMSDITLPKSVTVGMEKSLSAPRHLEKSGSSEPIETTNIDMPSVLNEKKEAEKGTLISKENEAYYYFVSFTCENENKDKDCQRLNGTGNQPKCIKPKPIVKSQSNPQFPSKTEKGKSSSLVRTSPRKQKPTFKLRSFKPSLLKKPRKALEKANEKSETGEGKYEKSENKYTCAKPKEVLEKTVKSTSLTPKRKSKIANGRQSDTKIIPLELDLPPLKKKGCADPSSINSNKCYSDSNDLSLNENGFWNFDSNTGASSETKVESVDTASYAQSLTSNNVPVSFHSLSHTPGVSQNIKSKRSRRKVGGKSQKTSLKDIVVISPPAQFISFTPTGDIECSEVVHKGVQELIQRGSTQIYVMADLKAQGQTNNSNESKQAYKVDFTSEPLKFIPTTFPPPNSTSKSGPSLQKPITFLLPSIGETPMPNSPADNHNAKEVPLEMVKKESDLNDAIQSESCVDESVSSDFDLNKKNPAEDRPVIENMSLQSKDDTNNTLINKDLQSTSSPRFVNTFVPSTTCIIDDASNGSQFVLPSILKSPEVTNITDMAARIKKCENVTERISQRGTKSDTSLLPSVLSEAISTSSKGQLVMPQIVAPSSNEQTALTDPAAANESLMHWTRSASAKSHTPTCKTSTADNVFFTVIDKSTLMSKIKSRCVIKGQTLIVSSAQTSGATVIAPTTKNVAAASMIPSVTSSTMPYVKSSIISSVTSSVMSSVISSITPLVTSAKTSLERSPVTSSVTSSLMPPVPSSVTASVTSSVTSSVTFSRTSTVISSITAVAVTSSLTPSVTSSITPSLTSSISLTVTSTITPSVTSSVTTVAVTSSMTLSVTSAITPSVTSSITPPITSSIIPSVTISTTLSVAPLITLPVTSSKTSVTVRSSRTPIAVKCLRTPVAVTSSVTPIDVTSSVTPIDVTSSVTPVAVMSSVTPVSVKSSRTPVTVTSSVTPVAVTSSVTPVAVTSSVTPVAMTPSVTPVAVKSSRTLVTVMSSVTPVAVTSSVTPVAVTSSVTPVAMTPSVTPVAVKSSRTLVTVMSSVTPVAVTPSVTPVAVKSSRTLVTVMSSVTPVAVTPSVIPVAVKSSRTPVTVMSSVTPVAVKFSTMLPITSSVTPSVKPTSKTVIKPAVTMNSTAPETSPDGGISNSTSPSLFTSPVATTTVFATLGGTSAVSPMTHTVSALISQELYRSARKGPSSAKLTLVTAAVEDPVKGSIDLTEGKKALSLQISLDKMPTSASAAAEAVNKPPPETMTTKSLESLGTRTKTCGEQSDLNNTESISGTLASEEKIAASTVDVSSRHMHSSTPSSAYETRKSQRIKSASDKIKAASDQKIDSVSKNMNMPDLPLLLEEKNESLCKTITSESSLPEVSAKKALVTRATCSKKSDQMLPFTTRNTTVVKKQTIPADETSSCLSLTACPSNGTSSASRHGNLTLSSSTEDENKTGLPATSVDKTETSTAPGKKSRIIVTEKTSTQLTLVSYATRVISPVNVAIQLSVTTPPNIATSPPVNVAIQSSVTTPPNIATSPPVNVAIQSSVTTPPNIATSSRVATMTSGSASPSVGATAKVRTSPDVATSLRVPTSPSVGALSSPSAGTVPKIATPPRVTTPPSVQTPLRLANAPGVTTSQNAPISPTNRPLAVPVLDLFNGNTTFPPVNSLEEHEDTSPPIDKIKAGPSQSSADGSENLPSNKKVLTSNPECDNVTAVCATDDNDVTSTNSFDTPLYQWTKEDVSRWLTFHGLGRLISDFSEVDGPCMVELLHCLNASPEIILKSMRELGCTLQESLKFSALLRSLSNQNGM